VALTIYTPSSAKFKERVELYPFPLWAIVAFTFTCQCHSALIQIHISLVYQRRYKIALIDSVVEQNTEYIYIYKGELFPRFKCQKTGVAVKLHLFYTLS